MKRRLDNIINLAFRDPKPEWASWTARIQTNRAAPVHVANETLGHLLDRLRLPMTRCELFGMPCMSGRIGPEMMAAALRRKDHIDPGTKMTMLRRDVRAAFEDAGLVLHRPIDHDYEDFARSPQPGYVIEGDEVLLNASATIQMNIPGRTLPVAGMSYGR